MSPLFSRLDNFYSRRTATAELTFRTCGNAFLLFGLLTMSWAIWQSFVAISLGLGVFLGDHILFWIIRAASMLAVTVVAALVMHSEARRITYESCDEKAAFRRAGLSLLLLAVVILSPLLAVLIYLFFPFRSILYLHNYSSGAMSFADISTSLPLLIAEG